MADPRCFKVDPSDNVATMLDDVRSAGAVTVVGDNTSTLVVSQSVKLGHKIALRDIRQGEAVLKFGVAIGRATQDIRTGDWVHLHNCTSNFDQRSQTLDLHTGAATDTKYE